MYFVVFCRLTHAWLHLYLLCFSTPIHSHFPFRFVYWLAMNFFPMLFPSEDLLPEWKKNHLSCFLFFFYFIARENARIFLCAFLWQVKMHQFYCNLYQNDNIRFINPIRLVDFRTLHANSIFESSTVLLDVIRTPPLRPINATVVLFHSTIIQANGSTRIEIAWISTNEMNYFN